jgi:hypothetical protein
VHRWLINGVCTGWLDCIDHSFTISRNHNNLQLHNKSSAESFFLDRRGLSPFWFWTSQSESYVTTDGRSARLSWYKAPMWCLKLNLYFCQTVSSLLMWGALSDERTAQSAVISLLSICTIYILHVTKCMYIQHIQDLCQSKLSTADHALSLVAPATTAV